MHVHSSYRFVIIITARERNTTFCSAPCTHLLHFFTVGRPAEKRGLIAKYDFHITKKTYLLT